MLGLFNKKSAALEEKKAPVLKSAGRKLEGTVVSNKMKKTVVVSVSYSKKHPKYLKYFTVTKRFKAHDETNQYQLGDKVVIQETRPLSKEKRWVVTEKA